MTTPTELKDTIDGLLEDFDGSDMSDGELADLFSSTYRLFTTVGGEIGFGDADEGDGDDQRDEHGPEDEGDE